MAKTAKPKRNKKFNPNKRFYTDKKSVLDNLVRRNTEAIIHEGDMKMVYNPLEGALELLSLNEFELKDYFVYYRRCVLISQIFGLLVKTTDVVNDANLEYVQRWKLILSLNSEIIRDVLMPKVEAMMAHYIETKEWILPDDLKEAIYNIIADFKECSEIITVAVFTRAATETEKVIDVHFHKLPLWVQVQMMVDCDPCYTWGVDGHIEAGTLAKAKRIELGLRTDFSPKGEK